MSDRFREPAAGQIRSKSGRLIKPREKEQDAERDKGFLFSTWLKY